MLEVPAFAVPVWLLWVLGVMAYLFVGFISALVAAKVVRWLGAQDDEDVAILAGLFFAFWPLMAPCGLAASAITAISTCIARWSR